LRLVATLREQDVPLERILTTPIHGRGGLLRQLSAERRSLERAPRKSVDAHLPVVQPTPPCQATEEDGAAQRGKGIESRGDSAMQSEASVACLATHAPESAELQRSGSGHLTPEHSHALGAACGRRDGALRHARMAQSAPPTPRYDSTRHRQTQVTESALCQAAIRQAVADDAGGIFHVNLVNAPIRQRACASEADARPVPRARAPVTCAALATVADADAAHEQGRHSPQEATLASTSGGQPVSQPMLRSFALEGIDEEHVESSDE
jgi:hypothetical protein